MVLVNMLDALYQIGHSFVVDVSLWWYLTPIILLWVMLEIYFGKYKQEKLGWNTSLGNAVTLTWISVESMRYLFSVQPNNFWFRFGVIILIMLYAVLIIYLSFSHKISARATYTLASPTPIYFLCTVTILWGHGTLELTKWVVLDLVALYFIIVILFVIIKKLMPESLKYEGEPPDLGKDMGLGKDLGPDLGKDMGLGKDFKL